MPLQVRKLACDLDEHAPYWPQSHGDAARERRSSHFLNVGCTEVRKNQSADSFCGFVCSVEFWISVLRHDLRAFEVETEPHFLQSFFAHGVAEFCFVAGVE